MNTKKMIASLVGVMLIATVLVMAVNAAGFDRDKYLNMPRMVYEYDADDSTGIYVNWNGTLSIPTVRIYGETGAIYPTQSYTGEDDFIYPNPVDAFDPGVIGKDSVTFNPAYIADLYKGKTIQIDNSNANEKIFLRAFYEPGYAHVVDDVMKTAAVDAGFTPGLLDVSMPNGALVTETTYMLVTYSDDGHSGLPLAGSAGAPGSSPTEFMLPVNSLVAGVPGMDNAEMVELTDAVYGDSLTNGTIEASMTWYDVNDTAARTFMDHTITYKGLNMDGKPRVDIKYVGNMQDRHSQDEIDVVLTEGQKTYVDRNNQLSTTTTPRYRWFINVKDIGSDSSCTLTLGRRLVAGETFYVNGVRYDMPAIYVTDEDKFKYITFQSPLPKCDGPMWNNNNDDQYDWSHVTSQWLANLVPQANDGGSDNNVANVWVLPPFNENHTMIDDIGLAKFDANASTENPPDWEICTAAGDLIIGDRSALVFNYTVESIEERFNTSLAERHARKDSVEIWNWWSIFTKPDHYTELVLPDQENATGESYVDTSCNPVDGNEYLITTSFIAPNCEAQERELLSKSTVDVHDIIDRADDIAVSGDDRRADYLGMPRMVFEFDASNADDLFVNVNATMPAVRIYGETGAIYPTQSYTGEDDFIYPNPVDAFDPGVIGKDSVTFNPAYIADLYKGKTIQIDNSNANEKIFLRAFYEPGYAHVVDDVMKTAAVDAGFTPGLLDVSMPNGALVTETTYMLVTYSDDGHSGLPLAGSAGAPGSSPTEFMLPVNSLAAGVPGMDNAEMVELTDAVYGDSLTNGTIEASMTWYDVNDTATRTFMDHTITYKGLNMDGKPRVDIKYVGNMMDRHSQDEIDVVLTEGQKTYVDRNNQLSTTTTPRYRWFINVKDIGSDSSCTLTLGRRLVAGETFYVNGVRYDMPAIYVTDEDKFKYITFQSPLPKCDGPMWNNNNDDQYDWSHVTSQWLANLVPQAPQAIDGINGNVANVWVLPPFNENHTMIDDIGLAKFDANASTENPPDWEICTRAGDIIVGNRSALVFNYTVESIEERFNTSLAERHAYDGSDEIWNWWSIFTKPYQYTELVLPDQENATTDSYEDLGCMPVDGNEYLITTSFIAPNSEGPERELLSKSTVDVHDIVDRAATLLVGAMQKPDLVITAVTCPVSGEINYTVKNQGAAAAGAFYVSIEATGVSETDSLSGLAAGASVTRTVAVDCVDTGYTVCADSGDAVDESNEGNNYGVSGSCTCDWNPWNDDCDITNAEISNAEYYWYTNTPINGHIITNAEISMLEYQWVTDDVC